MRVLLSTIGTRGDVQPLVGLASELRALGQDVRFCVPPDFCAWIDALGFSVTSIGPELRSMRHAAPSAPLSEERRRQLAESSVAAQFETIRQAADGCEVIVGATALQIAARSVAEKQGIRYVFAAYSPNVLPSDHHAPPKLPTVGQAPEPEPADHRERWQRHARRMTELFGPALNAHRASLGLAAIGDVQSHVYTDRPWLAADPVLAPWPEPADPAVFQPGAWIWRDERPLSNEVQDFLEAADPPICFGFGSMRGFPGLGPVLLDTARALKRRAIMLRGWSDLEPIAAPDCLTVDEVNQQALFMRVAAVVHHGGAGTTTAAAASGVPQVIVPQLYDQLYFASRVRELGIGTAHENGTLTPDTLKPLLAAALDASVAARSRAVAAAIRRDGARIAALRLVEGGEGGFL